MRIPGLLLVLLAACGAADEPAPAVEPYRMSEQEREFIRQLQLAGAGDAETAGASLHVAAAGNWKRAAELLLAKGAPVDARDPERRTPLHLAALQGHAHVADALLRGGADRNARDASGRTPAETAGAAGHDPLARYIRDFRP